MTVQPTTETPTPHELVSRLSLERKVELAAGASLWWTAGAPEIGLDPMKVSDGPHGVRGERFDERDVGPCTPCGTGLAASWDRDVVSRVGALVGEEARRQGVHVVLGPTMNIHRSPLGGRGFECYAEDPLLNGAIAAAWITGVQSRGVAATPKHFVCNDAETSRTTVDCIVDERALRDLSRSVRARGTRGRLGADDRVQPGQRRVLPCEPPARDGHPQGRVAVGRTHDVRLVRAR
jgi:beta-glucosidase